MGVDGVDGSEDTLLRSKSEGDLEGIILGFRFTIACLNISLNSHRHAPKNLTYRASVLQQYQSSLDQLHELLQVPTVVHTDDHAEIARDAIATFKFACQREEGKELLPWKRDVGNLFQQAADHYFAQDRIGREGKPCQIYEALLAQHARIPEFTERRSVPSEKSPAGILYQTRFNYTGEILERRREPDNPVLDHRLVGEMYRSMLQYVQGHSADEALRRMRPEDVLNFETMLIGKLGQYCGSVLFTIAQDEGHKPRIMVKFLDSGKR